MATPSDIIARIKYVKLNDSMPTEIMMKLKTDITLTTARKQINKDSLFEGLNWSFMKGKTRISLSIEESLTIFDILDNDYIDLVADSKKDEEPKVETEKELKERSTKLEESIEKLSKFHEKAMLQQAEAKLIDFSKTVAPGGFSSIKTDSYRTIDKTQWSDLVDTLGLPYTMCQPAGQVGFSVKHFVAVPKIDGGKIVASTIAINQTKSEVQQFEEEWMAKAFHSGYLETASSLSMSFGGLGWRVSNSTSVNFNKREENTSAGASKMIYMVGRFDIHKACIFLNRDCLKIDANIEKEYKDAIKSDTEEEQMLKVHKLLNTYGYVVPMSYIVGGQMTMMHRVEKSAKAESHASEFKTTWGATIGGGGRKFRTSDETKGADGKTDTSGTSASNAGAAYCFSAKGGSASDINNASVWAGSLSPDNWDVVSFDDMVPIFELFSDKNLRDKIVSLCQLYNQNPMNIRANICTGLVAIYPTIRDVNRVLCFGCDGDGHIHEFEQRSSKHEIITSKLQKNCLMKQNSQLIAINDYNKLLIFYISQNSHIIMLWCDNKRKWEYRDLTDYTSCPSVDGNAVGVSIKEMMKFSHRVFFVASISGEKQIFELHSNQVTDEWGYESLNARNGMDKMSTYTGGCIAATQTDVGPRFYYKGEGNIICDTWMEGRGYGYGKPGELAKGNFAAIDDCVITCALINKETHVLYSDTNREIAHLVWKNEHQQLNWTKKENGKVNKCKVGKGICSVSVNDTLHVFFIDEEDNIQQLLYYRDRCTITNISKDFDILQRPILSYISAVCDTKGKLHVYFATSDNTIHELKYSSNIWKLGDVFSFFTKTV